MRTVLIFTIFLICFIGQAAAQCTINPTAVAGLTLVHQRTDNSQNSGVAYNPNLGLYYAVRPGNSAYPLETWSSIGTPLFQNNAGFDWRGMWWNPNTNQLEGNGFSTLGIWTATLNGSGYATTSGTSIFTGMAQPDVQSVGDYDYDANEIIYYFSGSIYRYSRATDAFLGSYAITGTPVALTNLNSNTVMYTGCAGKEIALLDWVLKRVYLYNKATGAFVISSSLPAAAVCATTFKTSWSNNLIWLFNLANKTWFSYSIFGVVLPISLVSFEATLQNGVVQITWTTASEINSDKFIVERSTDGVNYYTLFSVDAAGNSTELLQYAGLDAFPEIPMNYYRLKEIDINGDINYSYVVPVANALSHSVSVYPNPVINRINIIGEDITSVTFMNAAGDTMEPDAVNANAFDIRSFASGIYFAKITSGNETIVKKIIRQ